MWVLNISLHEIKLGLSIQSFSSNHYYYYKTHLNVIFKMCSFFLCMNDITKHLLIQIYNGNLLPMPNAYT